MAWSSVSGVAAAETAVAQAAESARAVSRAKVVGRWRMAAPGFRQAGKPNKAGRTVARAGFPMAAASPVHDLRRQSPDSPGAPMQTYVYKSLRKPDTYIYLRKRDDFAVLPDPVRAPLGELVFVLEVALTPERKLARADAAVVRSNLA